MFIADNSGCVRTTLGYQCDLVVGGNISLLKE